MQATTRFRAFRTIETEQGFHREIMHRQIGDLPAGEVLVRVHYSSLNYKDALSATGHKGVTRRYPHTPGIDAAGEVVSSQDPTFAKGDEVIVTSYDLGMNTDGGFAEYIRVPAAWVIPKPESLSLKAAMVLGTAGFTAGLGLFKMERNGLQPDRGPVVVTGASGGVGSMAVGIMAKRGYEVAAVTGSPEAHDFLRQLGATELISREEAIDQSGKPLLRGRWAGAIDTVGGEMLASILKSCLREASVAVCGLVGSPKLPATVYPFILNGANLLGVDSATIGMETRRRVWELLAGPWSLDQLDDIHQEISLEQLDDYIDLILAGKTRGRIIIRLR